MGARRSAGRAFVVALTFVGALVVGTPAANATAASEKYVTKLYEDLLLRPPTTNEKIWGAAVLDGGTSRSAYIGQLLANSSFRTAWVDGVYYQYIGTDPTSTQLSTALADLNATNDYLDTELDLLASSTYFTFVGSTNEAFVEGLFADTLFREVDPSGWTYWSGQLNSGSKTRRQVAASVIRSSEGAGVRVRGEGGQTDCAATVLDAPDALRAGSYCLILDRMADPSGATYWTGQLTGSGQLPALWTSLASSNEYYNHSQA